MSELQEVKMTASELLQVYARGKRDFRGANLIGAYLCWANLREANLSGANLSGANLQGANLCGVHLGWVSCFTSKVMGAKTDFGIALVGGQSGMAPSSGRTTKYIIHEDGTIGCWTECFQGTDDDLEAACRENHSGFNLSWYLAQIDIMRQDRDYAINEEGANV